MQVTSSTEKVSVRAKGRQISVKFQTTGTEDDWSLGDFRNKYKSGWFKMSETGSGLGILRLPSPPEDYSQGYMARLTNTLELEKQATYFAASIGP